MKLAKKSRSRIYYHLRFNNPDSIKECLLLNRITKDNGCWEWNRTIDPAGYGRQHIEGRFYYVHRLSKSIFDGFDINSSLCVCHKCDNPPCFNPEHLFVGTSSENSKDRNRKGRQSKGIDHPPSKLNEDSVREIRRLYSQGVKFRDIQARFPFTHTTIWKVYARKTWKHII